MREKQLCSRPGFEPVIEDQQGPYLVSGTLVAVDRLCQRFADRPQIEMLGQPSAGKETLLRPGTQAFGQPAIGRYRETLFGPRNDLLRYALGREFTQDPLRAPNTSGATHLPLQRQGCCPFDEVMI